MRSVGRDGKELLMSTTTPNFTLNNGVIMPTFGLGVFQSPPADTVRAIEAAIGSGYRMIDTAAAYFNEREVGEGIRQSGVRRGELFVQTKLWISDYGYEPALRAFDASLRRLGLDYVDSYLLHWPMPSDFEATVAAYRAAETLLADGRTPAHIVLRWHIEHGLSVIPKSVRAERISENIDIFDFTLTADEIAAVDALDTGVRGGPDPPVVDTKLFSISIEDHYAQPTR